MSHLLTGGVSRLDKVNLRQGFKTHTGFLVKFILGVFGFDVWPRLKGVFWDEAKRTCSSWKELKCTLKSKYDPDDIALTHDSEYSKSLCFRAGTLLVMCCSA